MNQLLSLTCHFKQASLLFEQMNTGVLKQKEVFFVRFCVNKRRNGIKESGKSTKRMSLRAFDLAGEEERCPND